MSFAYPLALLLPLIFLVLGLLKPKLVLSFGSAQTESLKELGQSWRTYLAGPCLAGSAFIALCLLSFAAARPQKIEVLAQAVNSRNIMLALDVSESMSTQDFDYNGRAIDRISAVKLVVSDFIDSRANDRIGLVIFGANAYLQAPLTLEHSLLKQLVAQLEPGMAGRFTAIGDGLGVGLKRLEAVKSGSQALILLTDGVNNSGTVKPLQAAQVAASLGIKIHTIGIGSNSQVKQSLFGGLLGGVVTGQTEFDEETLKEISRKSHGRYFHAYNLKRLEEIYQEIDKLETSSSDQPQQNIVHELFAPWLLAGIGFILIRLLLGSSIFFRVP